MAAERGGRADKLGNRYEGLWVARQLLYVLRGQLGAVMVEGIGDDEAGVDLWITHNDGRREAQQCKRGNRLAGKWSVADLNSRDVLSSLQRQLQRDVSHRFTFVSADPAPELDSLSQRAASSGNDAERFYVHQIQPYKNHLEPFRRFTRYLHLDPEVPHDRRIAHDLLGRTDVVLFDAQKIGRQDVGMWASLLVDGDPATVIEVLAGFAEDNLGKVLHVDAIRCRLREAGLPPRDLACDANLPSRLEQLKDEFFRSLRATLINDRLIPRSETKDLIRTIVANDPHLPIVLHGRAGHGKSSVLLELAEYLGDGHPIVSQMCIEN